MTKDTQIAIRFEDDLVDRIDALVRKLGGVASRAALLRSAVVAGLPVLEDRYRDLPDVPGSVAKKRKKR